MRFCLGCLFVSRCECVVKTVSLEGQHPPTTKTTKTTHTYHGLPSFSIMSDLPVVMDDGDPGVKGGGGAALPAPIAAGQKGGSRSVKKKSIKSTKAAAAAGPKQAPRKKKAKDEIVFDMSDLHAPLPVNLNLYCKSQMTGRYHQAKILDRRIKDEKFKIQSVPWPASKNPPLPVVEGVQPDFSNHSHIYYVHFVEWDRRMDEWVYRDHLCLPSQVLQLQPPSYNIAVQENAEQAAAAREAAAAAAAGAGKEKKDEGDEEEEEGEEGAAPGTLSKQKKGKSKEGSTPAPAGPDAVAKAAPTELIPGGDPHGGSLGGHGNFSEEDIRAHEEATKVKNIESIVMGKYHMSTWYYSPFPSEYNQYNVLHFCEFCLNFFGYEEELKRHSRKCQLRHPPGNEIYRSQEKNVLVSVWEIDGAREKTYCQNLCWIAKLFLDHKTLEFDCTPFLFYVFCELDEVGYHIVGYFSKEKISQSKFNLACFPESDTRVLTNRGFLFLDEIASLNAEGETVEYASYHAADGTIGYSTGDIVLKHEDDAPAHLVDFTQNATRTLWDKPNDTQQGEEEAHQYGDSDPTNANHLSLRVTPDHDMFVQFGNRASSTFTPHTRCDNDQLATTAPFRKVAAGDLPLGFKCDCHDAACEHRHMDAMRFIARAKNGAHFDGVNNNDEPTNRIGLDNQEQIDAFMEIYGYWLCAGSLSYSSPVGCGRCSIVFDRVCDVSSLRSLLSRAGLESGVDWIETTMQIEGEEQFQLTRVEIYTPSWFEYFDQEYWVKYTGGRARRAVAASSLDATAGVGSSSVISPSLLNSFHHVLSSVYAVPLDQLVSSRTVAAPLYTGPMTSFAHRLVASGVESTLAYQPIADCISHTCSIILNLNHPLSSTIGANVDGVTRSAAFRSLDLSFALSRVPLELGWLQTLQNPIPWADGSAHAFQHVRAASMQASIDTGAKVIIAFGESVASDWHHAVTCANPIASLVVDSRVRLSSELSYYQVRTVDARTVFIVEAPHPSSSLVAAHLALAATLASHGEVSPAHSRHVLSLTAGDAASTAAFSPDSASSFWLWSWVLHRCSPSQVRLILQGLTRSGPKNLPSSRSIRTTTTAFREQIVQMCLHAGYSPTVSRVHDKEAQWVIHFTEQDHSTIDKSDVRYQGGAVEFTNPTPTDDAPLMHQSASPYNPAADGRLWCVSLPASTDRLIIAQRARRDKMGQVVQTSRPIVVGNCILTLPCHQRKGYGKLIISLSYELSKIEEKVGSPEKPISDLGKVSYMSYWSSTLLKLLSQRPWGGENAISIEDLSRLTCITTDDIIECLKSLHILIWYKGKWVFSDTSLQQCLKEREEKRIELAKKVEDPNAIFVSQCRPEKLHWTPFFVNERRNADRRPPAGVKRF